MNENENKNLNNEANAPSNNSFPGNNSLQTNENTQQPVQMSEQVVETNVQEQNQNNVVNNFQNNQSNKYFNNENSTFNNSNISNKPQNREMDYKEKRNFKILLCILGGVVILSLIIVVLSRGFIKDLVNKAKDNEEKENVVTKRDVEYDYYDNGEFKELKYLTINGRDISIYLPGRSYNELKIDKQDDFVLINYSIGGTCGFETWNLYAFDYDSNVLFSTKNYNNTFDKLVYSGVYSFDSNGKLKTEYRLSCDLDCNYCNELLNSDGTDKTCSQLESYKNATSWAEYITYYEGNGIFTNSSLGSTKKLIDDSYYRNIFNYCS